jgi:hypothetical protein
VTLTHAKENGRKLFVNIETKKKNEKKKRFLAGKSFSFFLKARAASAAKERRILFSVPF